MSSSFLPLRIAGAGFRRRVMPGLALAALVTACGLASTSTLAATPPDTVVIARNLSTVYTLDPHEAYEVQVAEVVNSVYTRLLALDRDTSSKVVPGVAQKWTISDDGTQYTFSIRSNLKFHSGQPVTAEDAAFSLQRTVLLARPPSFILTQFGWTRDNVRQRVQAKDGKLVLTLDKAYNPSLVLNALTTSVASIVERKLVLSHEKDNDLGNAWLRGNSAGSGAFRVVTWKPKEVVVLEANPGYYQGAPKIKNVVVRSVSDASTQRLLLERGDADMAFDLTPDQLDPVTKSPDITLQRLPRATTLYLALSQANPVLAKPEVQQAFRWLIDYDAIAKDLLKGTYRVNQAFLAQGVNGALPGTPYRYDPARARELLAKAGYAQGLRLTLDSFPFNPHLPVAQALQASFAKAGVTLDLKVGESLQTLTRYREGKHEMMLMTKSLDYNDPNAMTSYFTRDDPNAPKGAAYNHWKIPELTAKTAAAAVERDPEKRKQLNDELQRVIQNESPFAFILTEVSTIASRRNVSGYYAGATYDSGSFELLEKK